MEARSKIVVKFLPSLADFAFLMPLGYLFARMDGAKTLLGDCDTGWHIRTGEWIIAHGWVPSSDVFSFTKPGAPWFAWEWLSDVLLAKLNAFGGLMAVVLFGALLLAITFTALFMLVRRKSNPIVALAVTMIAAAASSIHWLARPHLFTLLFVVVFYAALEQVREGRTRVLGVPILAALPVISILWTNLHAGFFVGALMILAYGGGEVLRLVFCCKAEDRRPVWLQARRYFLSGFACLAASLVNPYTYHLHVHMAKYLNDPYNSAHILEFFSPSFHHPTAIFLEAMLVMAVAAVIWNLRQGRFTEALLVTVWAHGALLAARNIPIFAIIAAPPAAAAIQQGLLRLPELNVSGWLRAAVRKFNRVAEETADTDAIPRLHLVSILAVLLLVALVYAPHPPKAFRCEFDPTYYPARALATLRSDPAARVFTHDEWGDYLIYSLYPAHKVFVDGRSDFYGDDFENKYIDVLNVKVGWEKTLDGFGVDTILMPPSAPLSGALKESSHWRVVYDDGIALVFRPASRAGGVQVSAANSGDGKGRDREVTKTLKSDHGNQTQNLGANTMTFFRNLWTDEQGQDLIEYTLLMAFVALASAALFIGAGGSVKGIWVKTSTQLSAANAAI
jgi:Flp pilus assembly pilin Flp